MKKKKTSHKSTVSSRLRAAAKKIRAEQKKSRVRFRKLSSLVDKAGKELKLFRTLAEATASYIDERNARQRFEVALAQAQAQIPKPFYWRCADGRTLHPKEMDESHLRNSISFLQRRLTHQFGTATWLNRTTYHVQALHEMLKEADRRHIDV